MDDAGHQPLSHHTPDDYALGDRNPTEDIFVAERPWGNFQQFVSNEQVTVKIITVAARPPALAPAARPPR